MGAVILNRILILLASIGMVISALLWISYTAEFSLPCTGGGCDEVARSPYSRVAGIPLPALGFGYFGLLLVLALSRLQYPEQWRTYGKMIAALSTLGMLTFGYLTYIQLFVLNLYEKGTPCWWCLAAAGTNTLLWLSALVGLRGAPTISGTLTRELLQSVALSLVLVVAGLAYSGWQWRQATTAQVMETDTEKLQLLYLDGQGWRKGKEDASLVIVEFSDFQCPACRQAYEILEGQILPQIEDKTLFVFRHYPLINIHPMAWIAAAASEEAGKNGKFWAMYSALFESQEGLSPDVIEDIARKLGLDAKKIREAMDNQEIHFKKIYRDFEEGSKLGVKSTPTFIVVYEGKMYFSPGMQALLNTLNNTPEIRAYLGKPVVATPR